MTNYKCAICCEKRFCLGPPQYTTHLCLACSTGDIDVYMTPITSGDKKMTEDNGTLRRFDTGATRDTTDGKLDPEGFTHPIVMKQFYKYMSMHRLQSDGKLRDSDNWQKGIPKQVYMKSIKRHCDDLWLEHRGFPSESGVIAALCGIIFNTMGYLHEVLKERAWKMQDFDGDDPTPEIETRQEGIIDEQA